MDDLDRFDGAVDAARAALKTAIAMRDTPSLGFSLRVAKTAFMKVEEIARKIAEAQDAQGS